MGLAFYRKYRPRALSEVIGQEANIGILKNAAREGKIGHAYLFYGSRGTGKTTTARLIAKLVNCETRAKDEKFRKEGEPCGTCVSCKEIDTGNALDVVEIDAASNRGIDEIRNLKDGIGISPVRGLYKVYVIDEVHMLTGPAFNALLKTLEEPPAHAIFILATTEYEKVPATITSRTQRFLFKKLPKVKIMEKLKTIAKAEGIKIDEPALELIAAAAEGSVRDAESLLDQVSAGDGPIDLASAERLTGRVGFARVDALVEYMLKGDLSGALAHIATLQNEGYNLIELTKDVIHYLRKIISLKENPALKEFFAGELTHDELARISELATHATASKHAPLLRALIVAYGEMRYSPFAVVPLELALTEHLAGKN